MGKIILYHGSPNQNIVPEYGFGEDRHDYGKGFYLTESLELAKEMYLVHCCKGGSGCGHIQMCI